MITLQEMDRINANAVVLPRQGDNEPPAIELRDAVVLGYVARTVTDEEPIVVIDLITRGVDASSALACSAGGVLFELRHNGDLIAGGVLAQSGGRAKVVAAL